MSILSEAYNHYLLTEDKISKNQKKARNVIQQLAPHLDTHQTQHSIEHDIPASKLNDRKFLPGVARLFCTRQIANGNTIQSINDILQIINSKDYVNQFDGDLNGWSYKELYNEFNPILQQKSQQEREQAYGQDYQGGSKNYKIVQIESQEEAQTYNRWLLPDTDAWCITYRRDMWDHYTNNGQNSCYFLLRDDYQSVPPRQGEGYPLDDYGLSMVCVIVDTNGWVKTITSRWNHKVPNTMNGDKVMSLTQLSQIVGENLYERFNVDESEKPDYTKLSPQELYDECAPKVKEAMGNNYEIECDPGFGIMLILHTPGRDGEYKHMKYHFKVEVEPYGDAWYQMEVFATDPKYLDATDGNARIPIEDSAELFSEINIVPVEDADLAYVEWDVEDESLY